MTENCDSISESSNEEFKLDLDLTLLQKLRREGKLCDLNLQSTVRDNKGIIPCHKIVLFTASPFFQKELEKDDRSSFNFDKIGHETLEALIDYIYSGGRISLSCENVWDVLDGAQEWGLYKLKIKCTTFLQDSISSESVVRILDHSTLGSYGEVVNVCLKFIQENLEEVKSHSFSSMSADSIKLLVQHSIQNEFLSTKDVLEAVSEWLHEDEEKLKKHAYDLIKDIPLAKIKMNDLQRILRNDEAMNSIPEVHSLYVKALEDSLTMLEQNKGTQDNKRPSVVLKISKTAAGFQMYQNRRESEDAAGPSKRLCLSPMATSQAGTSSPHNDHFEEVGADSGIESITRKAREAKNAVVYFVTKSCSTFQECSLCSFNLESKESHELGTIPDDAKSGFWLGYHDGKIYEIVWKQLNVRAFHVKEMNWNHAAFFLQDKIAHSSYVFQGDFIYQIGGVLGSEATSVAKRRNLALGVSEHWDDIKKMERARCKAGVVVASGKIYVIGGYNRITSTPHTSSAEEVKEVECYDPVLNGWSAKSEMLIWRGGFAIATIGIYIYVMGGDYTNRYRNAIRNQNTMLNIVEVYDIQKDQWQSGVPMNRKRMCFSAIVHNNFIYAIGGDDNKHPTMERFDVNRQIWEDLGSCLKPDGNYNSVAFNVFND